MENLEFQHFVLKKCFKGCVKNFFTKDFESGEQKCIDNCFTGF